MTAFARLVSIGVGLLLSTCVMVVAPLPASATTTTLCKGYVACADAGMPHAGYAGARSTMYWRMYAGHNCTNYVAYRLVKGGLPNVRPWAGEGNASHWGLKMPSITNAVPMVGAVAWWRANVPGAGSAGHVAYVEKVISADEIIVSQDSWGGDFSWARITRSGKGWPSGFIHFNDIPMLNLAVPTVTGTAKVGGTLSASRGTWSPSDATTKFKWLANGKRIPAATSSGLALTEDLLGKSISVRVIASKLGYPTVRKVSAVTPAVLPGVITNTAVPTISGAARVDETLSVSAGSWSPAPDSITYQWNAGGEPIAGATTPTLHIDHTLVGKAISVLVTAKRDGYTDVPKETQPTKPVAPGIFTVQRTASISGIAQPGETLTFTPPRVSPKGSVSVQWMRDGAPIPGATGPTYRLRPADLGARISVRTEATRPGYTTLTTITALPDRIRTTPRIKVAVEQHGTRLKVQITVKARGVPAVTGNVVLKKGKTVLDEVKLRNGSGKTTLTGLRPGTYQLRVILPASATVERGMLVRSVTIR